MNVEIGSVAELKKSNSLSGNIVLNFQYWFFAVRNRCIGREGNAESKKGEKRRSNRLREKRK
jgi:hypothetical protein